jgi:hypothetical protein
LQQLVRAAAALPGPKLDVALWHRLEPWGSVLSAPASDGGADEIAPAAGGADDAGELRAATRAEVARLRALVAGCLRMLAARVEATLGPALARARQSWDRVDDLVILDAPLVAALARARQQLEAALGPEPAGGGPAGVDATAAGRNRPVVAAALEGLLALEAAEGLTTLCERRLSSLIRLRARIDEDLLPGGRPFLDLGAALAEAAQRWV